MSKKINLKIVELEQVKESLEELSKEIARTETQYEKDIALTIMKLINGKEFELDGEVIANVPNAMLDKIAKGICWSGKLEMDLAVSKYKNTLKIIDITQSQLNGYQSINRYLSEL